MSCVVKALTLNLFNRVHEKLTVPKFLKKFPIYLEPEHYLSSSEESATGCCAEQMSSGQPLVSCFFMIHFNISSNYVSSFRVFY